MGVSTTSLSTQHAASLHPHIALIFYTVSLTKAANISKQKYYHAAYPIFFGITPSLLFRRVSRLSYAGSHSGRSWDRGRGLSGINADILHKNLLIWSLGLSLWWSHGMNKFTASIPTPKRMNDIFASHNGCARSQSPRWFVVQTLPTAAQIAGHTLTEARNLAGRAYYVVKRLVLRHLSIRLHFPHWIYRELPEPVVLAQTLKPLDDDDFHDDE